MPKRDGPQFHLLKLQDLVLWVHLGCSEAEREKVQEVRVSLTFRFGEIPLGFFSDKLEETICYSEVAQAIQDRCEAMSFQLIERMASEIYEVCKRKVGQRADLSVCVHKVRPPVDRLTGGAHYQCGDFLD